MGDVFFWADEYQLLLTGQALNAALRCEVVKKNPLVRLQLQLAQKETWRLYWIEHQKNTNTNRVQFQQPPSIGSINQ